MWDSNRAGRGGAGTAWGTEQREAGLALSLHVTMDLKTCKVDTKS